MRQSQSCGEDVHTSTSVDHFPRIARSALGMSFRGLCTLGVCIRMPSPTSKALEAGKGTQDLHVQQQHFLLVKVLLIMYYKNQTSVKNSNTQKVTVFLDHALQFQTLPRGNIFNNFEFPSRASSRHCMHLRLRAKELYLGSGEAGTSIRYCTYWSVFTPSNLV